MSFILDALKKSESERKRRNAPGIASIPETTQAPPAAKWPWLVTGLLAINLVILVRMTMQPDTPQTQPTAMAPAESPSPTATEAVTESIRDQGLSITQPATESIRNAAQPVAERRIDPVETTAIEPTKVGAAETIPETPMPVTTGLPTLRELRASGQIQLPELHLDIHVYSVQADERFVFVNMSKYKEGTTLNEGPHIVEIATDGLVLDYFGTRFLLARE